MAATRALALLAKEDVPDSVAALYGLRDVQFGPEYLIPFPFDPRVLLWVAPAVAWAAVASRRGERVHRPRRLSRAARGAARPRARRHARADQSRDQQSEARRVPRGRRAEDHSRRAHLRRGRHRDADPARQPRRRSSSTRARMNIPLDEHRDRGSGDVAASARSTRTTCGQRRQRKGMSLDEARRRLYNGNYFGSCMVGRGDADALALGREPALPRDDPPGARGDRRASEGRARERHVHARVREARRLLRRHDRQHRSRPPSSSRRSRYAASPHRAHDGRRAAHRDAVVLELRIGAASRGARRWRARSQLLRQRDPSLVVDGEMQADTAFDPEIIDRDYPFSTLKEAGERADLPEPERGQHRLQAAEPPGRRDGDRADPRRHEPAGARARARRRRAGHRQHGRGRRRRRAGTLYADGRRSLARRTAPTPTIFSRL